jgi:hypothetical protein
MATMLGDARVKTISLQYAAYGACKADLTLESGAAPAEGARLTLVSGKLAQRVTVVRADLAAPDKPHVIVKSGAGWEQEIAVPLSWQEDSGVRLRTILDDLATAAGQEIERPEDRVVGSHYEVIASSPGDPLRYADALDALAEEGLCGRWRVDPDGITRFGPRAGTEVTSRATVLGRDGGPGYTRLGIDDPLPFLPGNMLDGKPIVRLVVTENSGQLTAEVWVPDPQAAPQPRMSMQRMMQRYFQEFLRTYVVDTVHADGRLDLVPPADAPHLPEMRKVEQWVVGGLISIPAPGTECMVMFRDRKRTRPIVCGFAPGVATLAVARVSDAVAVPLLPATFVGTIQVNPLPAPPSPATGTVIWPSQTMGNITTGTPRAVG